MSLITICIPAYESHRFIRATLQSVAQQDFASFKVLIAIERSKRWHLTRSVCEEFCSIIPVEILVNEEIKGWAKNIDDLLKRVDTPYFVILPHDDLLHPSYLSVLYHAIKSQRTLDLCYADMVLFGHSQGRKFRSYEGRSPYHRLIAFYQGGAEAVPWRGITSTSLISKGLSFNTNAWRSMWVECEYAQSLLTLAKVKRMPQGLYFKRVHGAEHQSVGASWYTYPEADFIKAFDHHRQVMLAGLERASLRPSLYKKVKALYYAAMLRRITYGLSVDTMEAYCEETIESIKQLNLRNTQIAMSMVHVVKSEIELRKKNLEGAEKMALESIKLHAASTEAHLQVAKIYLVMHEPFKAFGFLQAADALAPDHPLYLQLHTQFHDQINAN